jgi:UDP-N-acetylmuramoyl-L-alanyl-D-glutamate--2,6-diaminopimelate ligase
MKKLLKKLLPGFVFSFYHWFLALSGALFYGFPSKKIKVIGVTGTNGKSTVVFLTSKILEGLGYNVASVSSIQFKVKSKVWPNNLKMTMPGRLNLQSFISRVVKAECDYIILEVTSEGIKQSRHKFIDFNSAVFTNLTKEHIESHGSFENYKKAKAKLFESLGSDGKAIINLDDPNADYFLKSSKAKKWGYTLKNKKTSKKNLSLGAIEDNKVISAKNLNLKTNGVGFEVEDIAFNLGLLGKFNAYNALAAASAAVAEGLSLEEIKKELEQIESIPGRLELVSKEPVVIVDYAHTPDALRKVYQTLAGIKQSDAKLIAVLGSAGGGRDKWKRPEMGKISSDYCDYFILTNEDPYDEDPEEILKDIEKGFKDAGGVQYEKIIDREKAVKKAISLADKNDIVIITGKGCEPWMCIEEGKKIKWDDREIVRQVLNC